MPEEDRRPRYLPLLVGEQGGMAWWQSEAHSSWESTVSYCTEAMLNGRWWAAQAGVNESSCVAFLQSFML